MRAPLSPAPAPPPHACRWIRPAPVARRTPGAVPAMRGAVDGIALMVITIRAAAVASRSATSCGDDTRSDEHCTREVLPSVPPRKALATGDAVCRGVGVTAAP